LQADVYH